MRGILLGAGAVLLLGCTVTAEQLDRDAAQYQYWAERSASIGDYQRAGYEQRKANELRCEAARERGYGCVPSTASYPTP
jgi:hypothetical protein